MTCYNPFYKTTKEVMNWGINESDITDIFNYGGSDGYPGNENQ